MADLRTFDLNLLIAFDLLMKERNVSRAAEKMFISQSAMSHVLQRLRQQLEDPLLVKTPEGMTPTLRALSLVAPVAAVLKEVENLIRAPAPFDSALLPLQQRITWKPCCCRYWRRASPARRPA